MLIHTLKTMSKSRLVNSSRNSICVIANKVILLLFSFAFRTLLIKNLGNVILGLDGIFGSILSVLNVADMGISSAIMFSLYKPLAENDQIKIAAVMNFFRKTYICVGTFIAIVGLCLIPALPFLIKIPEGTNNVELLYVLTLAGTVISYFLSSRRIIFEADQKNYKLIMIDTVISICLQISQILLIIFFPNYIAILVLRIVFQILSNIGINWYAKRKYPTLKINKKEKLTKVDKKLLFGNTGAVMVHKIGGVMVTGMDSIIIGAFVSVVAAAIYSNYMLIIGNITLIVSMAISAITPSVGNLKEETNDINYQYNIFKMVHFASFWVVGMTAICLLCLLKPFIFAWLGVEYVYPIWVELVLVANYFISTMRFGIGTFCTAGGYFKQTAFKPILEGVINLVVSIVSVKYIGILGIFLGTLASLLLGSFWVDPVVTYKKWFKRPVGIYFLHYFCYTAIICAIGALTYFVCGFINVGNKWGDFFVRAIVCFTMCNGLFCLIFFKTKEFHALTIKVKVLFDKIKRKKSNCEPE